MTAEPFEMTDTAAAPPSPLREFWGYFRANRGAVAGLVVVVTVLLTAVFANFLAPYSPDLTNNAAFLQPPAWQAGGSWAYPLGTDAIGRDILRAAGDEAGAAERLAAAVAWIHEVALPHVPDGFRDSFLHRNPVNRALLTAASRTR